MKVQTAVPPERIRSLNSSPIRAEGDWVVYWMTAFRRVESNFAIQYARDWAIQLKRPLIVLEALRSDYPWASDRFHRFIIEGMQANAQICSQAGVNYFPYVEPRSGDGKGLIDQLSEKACLIVGDDFPCFFHPGMHTSIARRLACRLDLVDANCLMPLSLADRTFTVAHSYRRWMQKELPRHLENSPEAKPLTKPLLSKLSAGSSNQSPELIPDSIAVRWPKANLEQLLCTGGLNSLSIDHGVQPISQVGGSIQARKLLNQFVGQRLGSYDHDRNEPDLQGSSELSGYLHFGHISPHEVFWRIMDAQSWSISRIGKPSGKVNGFWGVDLSAEAFLDQLCTWREIGFNQCFRDPQYAQYESLPAWAQRTLAEHESDPRPVLYSLEQFEQAETHDPIWNAAQRQLSRDGRIHNYLRMLWGKKILHWTTSGRQALDIMIQLNNRYAIDGRDPNSYSGIFWVLGRYDRAWGPERPIFGKIRYMTSDSTARKHSLKDYLKRFGTSS